MNVRASCCGGLLNVECSFIYIWTSHNIQEHGCWHTWTVKKMSSAHCIHAGVCAISETAAH